MQIAVTPDPQRWVIIPPFPPPGWAREEARHRSAHLGVTGPQWRSELESLLNELQAMERQGRFARLMHIDDVARAILPLAHATLERIRAEGLRTEVVGVDYETYWSGGSLIHALLGPATVALALTLGVHLAFRRAAASIVLGTATYMVLQAWLA